MSRVHTPRRGRPAPAVVLLGLLLVLLVAPAAGAATEATTNAAVQSGAAWLATQQQPDGGFEVAQFPGFETRDAAIAIATAGQTGSTWSTSEALAAVEAVQTGGNDAIDALEAYAQTGISAGSAAKLIVLTTEPLGLDATSFGGTDLDAILQSGAAPDGSYGVFSDTLWAALAQRLLHENAPAATVGVILAAQQADGGWGFTGDPAASDLDPDTTGLAIQALAATGASGTDAAIDAAISGGLSFLARQQGADGSWKSPGDSGNPNSTALAILAIEAAGYDAESSCWRDVADPAIASTTYVSPAGYLLAQQASDGHFASPGDSFGLNTFATSQSMEALALRWLPVERQAAAACPAPTPAPTGGETAVLSATRVVAEDGTTVTGELPRTGASGGLALLGAALVVCGALCVALTPAARQRGIAGAYTPFLLKPPVSCSEASMVR